jgi:hypothetical protein
MYMGQVKSVYADVCDMLQSTNMTTQEIAAVCGVDVQLVTDIIADLEEVQYCGEVDELTEWMDYDPDC